MVAYYLRSLSKSLQLSGGLPALSALMERLRSRNHDAAPDRKTARGDAQSDGRMQNSKLRTETQQEEAPSDPPRASFSC